MTFSEAQLKSLESKLDGKHVKTRQVQEITLTYLEGWHVIAEANRIFGYDAWDRRTLKLNCVWSGRTDKGYTAAYSAQVRIKVRAGAECVVREGWGSGEARAATTGEAHELALKAAETDATKRALATFGNPFGLALYDRELNGVRNRKALAPEMPSSWTLLTASGGPQRTCDNPKVFLAELRKAMSQAPTIDVLFEVWERNLDSVRQISRHLRVSSRKDTSAQDLVTHLRSCAVALATPKEEAGEGEESAPRSKVDKSLLTISEPKRIRSKEHLRFVASKPCVVCGRVPSYAHHVRHAQPRGVSLKVSDEFTVPLCAIHHSENHMTGDERTWWAKRAIDPLKIARELWLETTGRVDGASTRESETEIESTPADDVQKTA
jgi:Rad52/22 family double-strand break repair protein